MVDETVVRRTNVQVEKPGAERAVARDARNLH